MTPCTEKDTLVLLKDGADRREKKLDMILEVLQGNSKPGLKTQVYLHAKYFKIIAVLGGLFITGRIAWGFIFP